jgi:hypothetical protein
MINKGFAEIAFSGKKDMGVPTSLFIRWPWFYPDFLFMLM